MRSVSISQRRRIATVSLLSLTLLVAKSVGAHGPVVPTSASRSSTTTAETNPTTDRTSPTTDKNSTTASRTGTTGSEATRITTDSGATASLSPTSWSVECLVVVDNASYAQWLSLQSSNITGRINQGRTKEEKERQAIASSRDFVTSTFLAANLIWKGIEEHGVRLDLRIQELIIVTEEVVAPPNSPDGKSVDSDTAYWAFLRWLVRKGKEFDHAVLLTGLNLVSGRGRVQKDTTKPGRPRDSEGYAYMDTMCSPESVSLVESHVNGVPAVVLAHEVAHCLGAYHDGDGNNCSRRSGHIMNDDNIGISPLHWKFSACSAAAIKRKLKALEDSFDCLSPGSTRADPVVYGRGLRYTGNVDGTMAGQGGRPRSPVYLGQLYTADQICQMREGTHSYLCRHLYGSAPGRHHNLCIALYCLVNSTYCSGEATADGLPCGSGKRCLAGHCVPFPDVPEHVSDDCYTGDLPHPAWQGQTCKQVVTSYTHLCQDQWYRDFCCQSCQSVRTADPHCPYGDAHDRCAPYYCGTAWGHECCQTCRRHQGSVLLS